MLSPLLDLLFLAALLASLPDSSHLLRPNAALEQAVRAARVHAVPLLVNAAERKAFRLMHEVDLGQVYVVKSGL